MNEYRILPGASISHSPLNQLLELDERCLLKWSTIQSYLLMPKSMAKLSALLFFLHDQKIDFLLSENFIPMSNQIYISMRQLNQVRLLENGTVEVHAGYQLMELQTRLFEFQKELGWENISEEADSIFKSMLTDAPAGLVLKRKTWAERLVTLEWMQLNGEIVKLGDSRIGPALHKLSLGMRDRLGVVVKMTFKTEPLPSQRVYLSWSFDQQTLLWDYFEKLHKWTRDWERLDCILSSQHEEKGFILAQLSGTFEEIKAFKHCCPFYLDSKEGNQLNVLKQYFKQQKVIFEPVKNPVLTALKGADYLWYHGLTDTGWLIYMTKQVE